VVPVVEIFGLEGELLVIVEGEVRDVWGVVIMVVINIGLVPETVSEKSGAVLVIYSYSLGAAFGGVR